jgi:hypothetical protein
MLKHYSNRPEALEETCLADFVSWYRREKITSKTSKKQKQLIMENDVHHTDDDDPDENTVFQHSFSEHIFTVIWNILYNVEVF